ncbi:MAG: sporulation integral membrane protein YtvI, partial [Eubacteriales bacterium]
MPEKGYKRTAAIVLYTCLALAGAYLFFRYVFACLLPFAAAFILAHITRRAVLFCCKKLKFSRFLAVLTVTLAVLAAVFGLLWLIVSRTVGEIAGLAASLDEGSLPRTADLLADSVKTLATHLSPALAHRLSPWLDTLSQNVDAFLENAAQKFMPLLLDTAIRFFRSLPKILLFIGALILSLFYFGCDYEKITGFIRRQLSEKQLAFAYELKNQFFVTIFSILRAYAILLCMTFLELWIGFLIIGIPYATLIALITALVDILPVFGTGTVLVPWGIIALLTGNFKTGLCILVLYVIITVIRQIAEPKILGSSVGMHSLITLMSMYFGLRLWGIGGLFLFPFAVIIIKNLNERGSIHLYKNPEPSLRQDRQ